MGWLRRLFDAVSEEEMKGLRLTGPSWEVSWNLADPSAFFRALPKLVPDDAILFLEGGAHPPRLAAFLQERQLWPALRPALGTIWPRQPTVALPTTTGFLSALAEQTDGCAVPEICSHLHVYRGEQVLLEGYDAFNNAFYVSQVLPEGRLRDFCADLEWSWKPRVGTLERSRR